MKVSANMQHNPKQKTSSMSPSAGGSFLPLSRDLLAATQGRALKLMPQPLGLNTGLGKVTFFCSYPYRNTLFFTSNFLHYTLSHLFPRVYETLDLAVDYVLYPKSENKPSQSYKNPLNNNFKPFVSHYLFVGVMAFFILLSSFCITAHADEIDDIIPAIIQVESGGNPNAVSPQGCIGLMQINPNGALKEWNQAFAGKESVYTIGMSEDKRKAFYLTSEDMKNPKWNKRVGRWYLEKLRFYYLAKVIERKKKPCRIRYNNDVWLKAETVDVEYSLSLILAAYNGGTGRLKKCNYDIDCMPKETQNYVRKVMKIYKHTEVSQCLKK